MITLRENQIEPIKKAVDFFAEKNPKPSLIVLPTAWGKSILTAHVAAGTADNIQWTVQNRQLKLAAFNEISFKNV